MALPTSTHFDWLGTRRAARARCVLPRLGLRQPLAPCPFPSGFVATPWRTAWRTLREPHEIRRLRPRHAHRGEGIGLLCVPPKRLIATSCHLLFWRQNALSRPACDLARGRRTLERSAAGRSAGRQKRICRRGHLRGAGRVFGQDCPLQGDERCSRAQTSLHRPVCQRAVGLRFSGFRDHAKTLLQNS